MTEEKAETEADRLGVGAQTVLGGAIAWAAFRVAGNDPSLAGVAVAAGGGSLPVAGTMFARLLREWRRDQEDNVKALNIVTAIEGGWTDEELAEKAGRSQATRMLTGIAIDAAARTAWPPKVIALGRVLAQGLSTDGDELDIPQYMLAAMSEMGRIHVELLELLVEFMPEATDSVPATGVLPVRATPCPVERRTFVPYAGAEPQWTAGPREWPEGRILSVRANLRPVLAGVTNMLEGHGLATSTDGTEKRLAELAKGQDNLRSQVGAVGRTGRQPRTSAMPSAPAFRSARTWRPTPLGEQVLGFYAEAAEQADAE
jgi:hypothetical protein